MVDLAKQALDLMFPETEDGARPEPRLGCMVDEPGSGGESEGEPAGEGESEGESESESESEAGAKVRAQMEQALADAAKAEADQRAEDQAAAQAPAQGGQALSAEEVAALSGGGSGADASADASRGGTWRNPTAEERQVQANAERFLRDLVSPSESSKEIVSDSPSVMIDGAAMAAWKASGGTRDPRFFRHRKRVIDDAPPVRVAVLVDVSGSMHTLQAPSALLSWALASAAFDLRNLAGRGAKVESCLIHWGSWATTVQRNGQMLPGIREVPCAQGTLAMSSALDLVAEEMPGFFEPSEKPENRLLVQFTDWKLMGGLRPTTERIDRALAAGVNMLSVMPSDQRGRGSLDGILAQCKTQRGTTSVLRYNPMFPEQVWDSAAEVLG